MTRRRALWLVAAVVVLAVIAVLIPGTPFYLLGFFASRGQHEGHSTSYWMKALEDPDAEVRNQAIANLGTIGAEAPEAVPALAKILSEHPDREARNRAALALSKMDPASRAAVPALAKALADEEPFIRMNAARALFRLRAEARPAVPALTAALKDETNQTNLGAFTITVQEQVALALGRASAGTAEGVGPLTATLEKAGTDELRLAVARALGEIGPEARAAVPQLRALLQAKDSEVRQAAEEALQKIGAGPAENEDEVRASDGAEKQVLAEDEREYLWAIEHHGNLLVKHGFGPLAAALKVADATALSRLLADNFAGTDLGEPHRVRAATGYAEVERLQDAGRPPVPLGPDAFVARLLELRKVFADAPPRVKLALMTLQPKVRGKLDGLWEGTAQLRMYGEQAAGGPAEAVAVLRYEVPRPTEEALAGPGWLRGAGVLQVLTARAPSPLFAEVTRQSGLDSSKLHDNWKADKFDSAPGGVYVCDFDRDGILDVLITDVNGCALYQGRPGGTFEDVTTRYGLPRRPFGRPVAAWVDLDGDGWEDLLLGDRVYRNEGGQGFVDYTVRSRLHLPSDWGGAAVADYDRDGRLDLYVTRSGRPGSRSWLDGTSSEERGNYLFRNKGDWQFEDVTQASGAGGGRRSTFAAAWLDANDDGWPDLYVINEFGDGVLLANNGDGTFAEHALADRPTDFGTMGLAVGDVNNDGRIDIYCANMYSKAGTRVIGNLAPGCYKPAVQEKMRRFVTGSQLHLNQGGLKFEQAGTRMQVAAVGWAYGACLADLDNDGWLDIYATAGFVSRNRDEPDG